MRGHVPPREYIVIETAARVSRPTGMRRRRDMKQLINKIALALALALAPGCGEYEGTMETRSELDPVVLDETTPSFSFTAFVCIDPDDRHNANLTLHADYGEPVDPVQVRLHAEVEGAEIVEDDRLLEVGIGPRSGPRCEDPIMFTIERLDDAPSTLVVRPRLSLLVWAKRHQPPDFEIIVEDPRDLP